MILRSVTGSTKGTLYEVRNLERLPEGYQGDYRMLMYTKDGGEAQVVDMPFVSVIGLFPYDNYEVVDA